jgi:hypothetical protein
MTDGLVAQAHPEHGNTLFGERHNRFANNPSVFWATRAW